MRCYLLAFEHSGLPCKIGVTFFISCHCFIKVGHVVFEIHCHFNHGFGLVTSLKFILEKQFLCPPIRRNKFVSMKIFLFSGDSNARAFSGPISNSESVAILTTPTSETEFFNAI